MFSRRLGYAPSWQVMISTPSLSACSISFPALSQSVKDLILLAVFGPIPEPPVAFGSRLKKHPWVWKMPQAVFGSPRNRPLQRSVVRSNISTIHDPWFEYALFSVLIRKRFRPACLKNVRRYIGYEWGVKSFDAENDCVLKYFGLKRYMYVSASEHP